MAILEFRLHTYRPYLRSYCQNCTLTNLYFLVWVKEVVLTCLIHFFPYAFLVLYFDRVISYPILFFYTYPNGITLISLFYI